MNAKSSIALGLAGLGIGYGIKVALDSITENNLKTAHGNAAGLNQYGELFQPAPYPIDQFNQTVQHGTEMLTTARGLTNDIAPLIEGPNDQKYH